MRYLIQLLLLLIILYFTVGILKKEPEETYHSEILEPSKQSDSDPLRSLMIESYKSNSLIKNGLLEEGSILVGFSGWMFEEDNQICVVVSPPEEKQVFYFNGYTILIECSVYNFTPHENNALKDNLICDIYLHVSKKNSLGASILILETELMIEKNTPICAGGLISMTNKVDPKTENNLVIWLYTK